MITVREWNDTMYKLAKNDIHCAIVNSAEDYYINDIRELATIDEGLEDMQDALIQEGYKYVNIDSSGHIELYKSELQAIATMCRKHQEYASLVLALRD